MSDIAGRSIDGKIRLHDGLVFFSGETDGRPCKCCAFECEAELDIQVTFCGMTLNATVQIPGVLSFAQVDLPDGSYIILSAQITCGPCGWAVDIGVCAYCDATQQAASDGFVASIPFADSPEANGSYCPETGAIDLTCFGDQFGIPCVTTTTASIA